MQQHIIAMCLNASGVRGTAPVLRISTGAVLSERTKSERAGEVEIDMMGSCVGKKQDQRWWWHAIDHTRGAVVADVFGRRKDEVFLQRKALLEP